MTLLQRFQALPKPFSLVLLCLFEALVFLVDVGTGPYIPIGPYYLLPLALSTWCMGAWVTALLVVVSCALRTYSVSEIFPADASRFYIAAFLSSAIVYSVIVYLLYRLKLANEVITGAADALAQRVEKVEYTRQLELAIRRAIPSDVERIVELSVLGAADGDFAKETLDSARQQALKTAYKDCIEKGEGQRPTLSGELAMVPIEFWVAQIGDKVAGYFMILGMDGRYGAERELHAISVAKEFQGLGIGRAMVDFFCAHFYGRKLYAACMPDSRIHRLLRKRAFFQYSKADAGYVILERAEWPREKGLLHDSEETPLGGAPV